MMATPDAMNKAVQNTTEVEDELCSIIKQRQQFGIRKYGRTVANNPLTHKEWLQHALEEALDLAVYLRRTIREIGANEGP